MSLDTGTGEGESPPGEGNGAVADRSGGINRPPVPALALTAFDNLSDNASLFLSPSDWLARLRSEAEKDELRGMVELRGGTPSCLFSSLAGVEGGEWNLKGGTFVVKLPCERDADKEIDAGEAPTERAIGGLEGGEEEEDAAAPPLGLLPSTPESNVRPPVKPSIDLVGVEPLSLREETGLIAAAVLPPVSCLMSISGLGGPPERALPFEYDDMALPGRRGGNSVASGALSESESSLSELLVEDEA